MKERNHQISAEEREKLRKNHLKISAISAVRPNLFSFNAEQVKKLLEQKEASGFVVELVATDSLIPTVCLSAVDGNGKELPMLLELAINCPPWC